MRTQPVCLSGLAGYVGKLDQGGRDRCDPYLPDVGAIPDRGLAVERLGQLATVDSASFAAAGNRGARGSIGAICEEGSDYGIVEHRAGVEHEVLGPFTLVDPQLRSIDLQNLEGHATRQRHAPVVEEFAGFVRQPDDDGQAAALAEHALAVMFRQALQGVQLALD